MILYIENSKESTKRLLKSTKKQVHKIAGYKLNRQKPTYFYSLGIDNSKVILKDNSIFNSIKKKKILRNKFNKISAKLKFFQLQNIIEKIKEHPNKWNIPHGSWIGSKVLHKLVYTFNIIPIKFPVVVFFFF